MRPASSSLAPSSPGHTVSEHRAKLRPRPQRAKSVQKLVTFLLLLAVIPKVVSEVALVEDAVRSGDYDQARALLEQAVSEGDGDAAFRLGLLYRNGKGVPQDYEQTLKWYLKGATLGNGMAQTGLGYLYYKGLGVPQDNVQAYAWFDIAVEGGHDGGKKIRDWLVKTMPATELEQGKALVRRLQESIRAFPPPEPTS